MISVLNVEVWSVDPDVEVSISEEVSDISRSGCWSHDPDSWSWGSDSTYWNPHSGYGPAILRGSDSGADSAGDEGLDLTDYGGDQVLVADGAGG